MSVHLPQNMILSLLHTFDAIFYTGTSDVKMNNYHPTCASFLNGISAKGTYRTYFLWIIAALLSMMAQSIVIMFEDSRLAMLIITALWIGIYYGNQYFFIGYAMQPFVAENTLKTFVMSYVTYVPVVIAWIIASYIVVKYSKFDYYFCFVPFDCDYVLVEGKKYKTQTGRIKTKKAGTVKFRIATFVTKEMLVSNYNEDTVAFYDTSGNVHRLPK